MTMDANRMRRRARFQVLSLDGGGIRGIFSAALLAGLAVGHQPRGLEHLQVLRDRGPADGELAGQRAHGRRPFEEPLEDRPARGVAQRGPACRRVSLH